MNGLFCKASAKSFGAGGTAPSRVPNDCVLGGPGATPAVFGQGFAGASLGILFCLSLGLGWGIPLVSADEPVALPVILKAQGEITIDGRLDEPDWQRATPIPVHYIYPRTDQTVDQPRMTARYLWDDFYLYIGYEVFDRNLVVKSSGEFQGPPDNRREGCEIWVNPPATQVDLAEFFIIFNDTNMFWEIHHNAANHFNDVLAIVNLPAWRADRPAIAAPNIYFSKQEFIQDQENYKLAMAVTLKPRADGQPSTVNDETDADTGYFGELRLPWFGIGAPAAAQTRIEVAPREGNRPAVYKPGPWQMGGREISILAVSQDGDAEHRYTSSASRMTPNFFHLNTMHYPRYRLVEQP